MTGETLLGWVGASVASAIVSVVVARMTAVNTLETKNAVLAEREENHYHALDRKIDASAAALHRRIDASDHALDQKLDLVLKAIKQ